MGIGGDEGGHLAAAHLGGYGGRDNIVPQNKTLNKSSWATLEKAALFCMTAPNSIGMFQGFAFYGLPGPRPHQFSASVYGARANVCPINWTGKAVSLYNAIPTPTERARAHAVAEEMRLICASMQRVAPREEICPSGGPFSAQ
jgi:hypothetical protein